jgi:DNA-binding CsgD family transcriptional regulator
MAKWDFDKVEQAFLDAALDSKRWNATMEVASRFIESRGAALFSICGRLPLMPHSECLGEGFETYVREGWIERDERFRGVPTILRKRVATDLDFATADEIKRNPYYQEFLAPMGYRWFAGVLVGTAENQWTLAFQRTIEQGPFSPSDQKELAQLSARLSGAAALAAALGFAAAGGAVEAFEFSGTAVIQLDKSAGVIGLNVEAERLMGRGIRIVRRRLVAERPDATDVLDRALHALLWSNETTMMPPVALPRDGGRPLMAYPIALRSVADNPFAHCRALVVLLDPNRTRLPPETMLRTAFALTAAEARLAAGLARGAPVEAVADGLGVTKATARNQLKAVFAKTGVHRQAELVALIYATLGSLF